MPALTHRRTRNGYNGFSTATKGKYQKAKINDCCSRNDKELCCGVALQPPWVTSAS